MKTLVLLFAVLAFSNCEENGPVQFQVVSETTAEIAVNGFEGLTSYSTSEAADLSDLLDSANTFIEADITKVTLVLKDYDGTAISGTIKITVDGVVLIDQVAALSTTPLDFIIPELSGDVVSSINSGTMTISMEGTTTEAITDNAFVIVVTPTVVGLF